MIILWLLLHSELPIQVAKFVLGVMYSKLILGALLSGISEVLPQDFHHAFELFYDSNFLFHGFDIVIFGLHFYFQLFVLLSCLLKASDNFLELVSLGSGTLKLDPIFLLYLQLLLQPGQSLPKHYLLGLGLLNKCFDLLFFHIDLALKLPSFLIIDSFHGLIVNQNLIDSIHVVGVFNF